MTIELIQINAFTRVPFAGNPAAVCPLDAAVDADWMQAIAAEMNLSETAFVWPDGDTWNLRWFTPVCEVDLCGHATLASAHALWETQRVTRGEAISFATRSGTLHATPAADAIELDFPATPATVEPPPSGLLDALGVRARETARNREDCLVEVDSESTLRAIAPDFGALKAVSMRGVIVTTRGDGAPYDFVSRFFVPAFGIDEDPVTGSAHCTLGPYWSERLGKTTMTARQASARGGEVGVVVRGNRVALRGHAVTVWRGILAPAATPKAS